MVLKCICGVLVNISKAEFPKWRDEHQKVTPCEVNSFKDLEEVD